MAGLQPQHVQQIHKLIEEDQILTAIQIYRLATGANLADAKRAVEEMARNERVKPPADVRDYDNPVLNAKIRSLLSKGRKIDAIKIYQNEYGIGLQEAQMAVERIGAEMPRDTLRNAPYESAIGNDPFADDGANGRKVLKAFFMFGLLVACMLISFYIFSQ
ncbi:MAG: hypothetical protein LC099_11500 [Anaerolineales bacterium]|nr:hypothetical protein [Anaerolineales bacterium]